ncbi:hypothetical protein DFH94DRAFT_663188 [Russula ochroleuca]|jgi:hypothetical protein|uniref:Uncharacterized protein n=1 Tax=Russula ochroleuca TaxID=152965 RepID=A0A9P5N3A1_9AGAM|nr:hypothetical protein DFH94DRAFT_663188 [Russula ochroleuca]
MVYIPFASLLGLQAALEPLVLKQPVPDTASIAGFDFIDPRPGGGSLLDHDSGSGLGEPLNVIISGNSDPWVLADGGFVHFANGLGFGVECFGAHLGAPQTANLGDGHGWVNQTFELRDDYGNPDIGSCWESLLGGNHLRLWRQNGPNANTGAVFLAVSEEENLSNKHTVAPNGYNAGRDNLVKSALALKQYQGVKYSTVAKNITGLIPPGSSGINHGIATDGVVVLLTVKIVK